MPSQYIIVEFYENRIVYSGGTPVGDTNTLITINAGTHTFTLSDPQNYSPPSQKVTVTGTAVGAPLTITFTLNAPECLVGPAPAPAAPP